MNDDSYSQDMDVTEALRLGLVVPVQGQRQMYDFETLPGTPRCGALPAFRIADPDVERVGYGPICGRVLGHTGPHVFVLRWEESWKQIERDKQQDRERKQDQAKAMQKAGAEVASKMKDIAEQAKALTEVAAPAMKAAVEMEYKQIHRLDSMAFGPDQSKRNKYRDRHVGKVRGK